MNEQTKNLIDTLCEKFGIVIDWANENVVPYLESLFDRIISFKIATDIFAMCFLLLVTTSVFFIARYFHRCEMKLYDPYDDFTVSSVGSVASWCVFGILAIASIIAVAVNIYDILLCVNIPEKAIIDFVMGCCNE